LRDQLGLNEEIERMMAADRARGERRREQARARRARPTASPAAPALVEATLGDFFELKRRGKLRARSAGPGIIASRRRRLISRMKRILIVDDESSMRFLLRMILENAGYEILEAHHGAAALERINEWRPDLVVTDLMMPVMNGRDLVGRLRADPETAGIPILLLSANPQAEVATVDAVMGKPFDPEAVVVAARSLAGSRG